MEEDRRKDAIILAQQQMTCNCHSVNPKLTVDVVGKNLLLKFGNQIVDIHQIDIQNYSIVYRTGYSEGRDEREIMSKISQELDLPPIDRVRISAPVRAGPTSFSFTYIVSLDCGKLQYIRSSGTLQLDGGFDIFLKLKNMGVSMLESR
jgi:hypothetical protein